MGFVGANGAGKTTTMRIIMGLLTPDLGTSSWNGAPLNLQQRRRLGYMPEERGLYPKMKVAEQITYFARLRGLSASDAAAAVSRLVGQLSLEGKENTAVEALSLGNQQRVQLAVALVADPVALVLDEPFSGLDPIAVDSLVEVLQARAAEGVAVLFSSHQLELVERICDSVSIISAGQMVTSGPVTQLRAQAERKLKVVVRGAENGWAQGFDGDFTTDADVQTLITVTADDQAVLRSALQAGRVEQFGWLQPSLAEIFREVVA